MTMTLEQFRATRQWCNDIGASLSDLRWEYEPAAKGYVYLDSFYIEEVPDHWPAAAKAQGKWYLIIERDEEITDDLPRLEERLWEFAKSEGYCGD